MIIGLTGGMGCGKSTAAGYFEKRNFRRLDSDALVRDQVLTLPKVQAELLRRFGPKVFSADGVINRPFLAERVFAGEDERRWLEDLTHPILFDLWRAALGTDPGVDWIVEVPLLFEKKLEIWFDFTVCVACAVNLQLDRLEQRGMPRVLAEQRISTQLPLAHKIEQADFVLWNEGSPEFLRDEVDRLIGSLVAVR